MKRERVTVLVAMIELECGQKSVGVQLVMMFDLLLCRTKSLRFRSEAV